jgi:predicted outer membrane protein
MRHSGAIFLRSGTLKRVSLLAAVAGLSLTVMGSAPPRRTRVMIDDAAIVTRLEDLVSADIDCAQLAVERGHGKDVRDLAGVLVREHGMARQLVRDLASQLHITLKPSSDSPRRVEHAKVVSSLRDRPDAAFDILFVRHEIDYHKEIGDLITKEWLPAAKNEDLIALLSQVGPAFEAHSTMATAIWQRLAPPR